jgi:hypothetical protein
MGIAGGCRAAMGIAPLQDLGRDRGRDSGLYAPQALGNSHCTPTGPGTVGGDAGRTAEGSTQGDFRDRESATTTR